MILGIDEVGRGPYAGPLVIGACILPDAEKIREEPEKYHWISELTDSKKLTARRREVLYDKIKEGAAAAATGWVSANEIDEIGLSESLKLACRRAVKQIQETHVPFSEIIIDGTINFLNGTPLEKYVSTLKKGDFLIKEISAASILAKVERDRYMTELAEKYPEYGFEKHVGYGTAAHQKAMEEFGLTPEHRRSFRPVREILSKKPGGNEEKQKVRGVATENGDTASRRSDAKNESTTTGKSGIENESTTSSRPDVKNGSTTIRELGNLGEEKVAEFLISKGHEIIARNFRTKYFEIDIISKLDDSVFFTEVKYRKTAKFGEAIEFVDRKKQEQVRFAAESYLAMHPEFKDLTIRLAVAGVSGGDFRIEDWMVID